MPRSKKPQTRAKELARETAIETRQREVFRLWSENPLQGYRAIGKQLDPPASRQTVCNDLHAVLQSQAKEFCHEVDAWKEKQIQRLEHLLDQFESVGNSAKQRIAAGRLILAILRELNEVTGVRAAVKVEHSGTIGFNWSEITADAKSSENHTDDSH